MGGNGAVAPHAAFTKTGHQAQRTVQKPTATDNVVTAFHPEEEVERTLLFGSNFVEIQPSTANSSFGSTQTFTFSNDVDAIGDVYARIELGLGEALQFLTDNGKPGITSIDELALARVIDRCEVMVGNSTWQTLENSDIVSLAATKSNDSN